MPKIYSEELRWCAVWQRHLQHKSVGAIARDLYVLPRSAEHWVKLFDVTKNVSPKESRYGPSHKLTNLKSYVTVLQTLLNSPSIYLDEVQSELFKISRMWIDC